MYKPTVYDEVQHESLSRLPGDHCDLVIYYLSLHYFFIGSQTCCLCVKAFREPVMLSGLRHGRLYLVFCQVNRLWTGWCVSQRN